MTGYIKQLAIRLFIPSAIVIGILTTSPKIQNKLPMFIGVLPVIETHAGDNINRGKEEDLIQKQDDSEYENNQTTSTMQR